MPAGTVVLGVAAVQFREESIPVIRVPDRTRDRGPVLDHRITAIAATIPEEEEAPTINHVFRIIADITAVTGEITTVEEIEATILDIEVTEDLIIGITEIGTTGTIEGLSQFLVFSKTIFRKVVPE